MKLCSPFYWKYLIQKPLVRDGKVTQKGHWFGCGVVMSSVSMIKPWVITKDELEASKTPAEEKSSFYGKSQQTASSSDVKVLEKKRRRTSVGTSRKRNDSFKDFTNEKKPKRDQDSESEEEEESPEPTPKKEYFSMYR